MIVFILLEVGNEASQQTETDDQNQIPLLGQKRSSDQNQNHGSGGQGGSQGLNRDILQNVGIHIGSRALSQRLDSADADPMRQHSLFFLVFPGDGEYIK